MFRIFNSGSNLLYIQFSLTQNVGLLKRHFEILTYFLITYISTQTSLFSLFSNIWMILVLHIKVYMTRSVVMFHRSVYDWMLSPVCTKFMIILQSKWMYDHRFLYQWVPSNIKQTGASSGLTNINFLKENGGVTLCLTPL